MMKRYNKTILLATAIVALLSYPSCRSSYHLETAEGSRIEMTTEWDNPRSEAATALLPYKEKVDSIMLPVVGRSAMDMTAKRPESLLSNLIADVLRNAAIPYLGRPADMGLINVGGLRNSLSAGDITYGNVYEILPFENYLCIVTLKGKDMKELMTNIMNVFGEGVSNVYIEANGEREILDVKIGGEPIDDDRLYEVATIDYLAEGNDKMSVFLKAEKKGCYEEETVRLLFLKYIQAEAAEGREISSALEGRITIRRENEPGRMN